MLFVVEILDNMRPQQHNVINFDGGWAQRGLKTTINQWVRGMFFPSVSVGCLAVHVLPSYQETTWISVGWQ